MDEKMDPKYNELNEFLDTCINEALKDTAGKFQVGMEDIKGFDKDKEKEEKSERFKGFKKDEIDFEGEKMKDYERPPPFRVYQRPLTSEETKSYKQYEVDMSKLKPGKERPEWDGYDKDIRGVEKTEEWKKDMKPRHKKVSEPPTDNQRYSQPERKRQPRPTYDFATKPSTREPSTTHKRNIEVQEEPGTFRSTPRPEDKVSKDGWPIKPKFSREQFQPTSEQTKIDGWPIKPKFSREQFQPTYEQTEIDRSRRYSDPATIHKQSAAFYGGEPEGRYQTFENFYKNVAKSDLPPDYNKEDSEPQSRPDSKEEIEAEDNEKMEPGMNSEKVKKELLKLRPVILDRASWGALPPQGNVTPMVPPADTLVFTLNTGTPACYSEDDCRKTVKEIQARHMGRGLGDIQYNFLVGGDGNLYEGRGWGYESGIKQEKKQGKSYNIAFIGNYQENIDSIPPQMLGPVQDLVIWGNAIRLVTNDTKGAGEYRVQKQEEPENNPQSNPHV